ncbi:OmpH/Skp family outer membrane protein [Candidatus Bandiella euplotis]|uniref:OmpH family outer membrane protein n=1 Tax=Candidatus Bandiella euplotis TaxID=1664265 RepID=A0ABZ0UKG8_9RICK|nr:OmpH family outer membrane protein [Candidatus Bandiella woodruffii]WPX96214.1 OmpH family outer membrane protein [Candidatus Bandiella woodruffii]
MKILKLLTVLFALCLFSTVCYAETNLGLVDIQKIAQESNAFKDAMAKIESKAGEFQKNTEKLSAVLTKKGAELEKQKNVLSPEEYNKRQDAFSKEVEKEEKNFYNQRIALEKATQTAKEALFSQTKSIIENIAKTKSISVVFDKNFAFYNVDSIDITNDVLLEVNKQLKSIEINLS